MDACFHGGAFWDSIPLDRLDFRHDVVNADVLDAWFPPAPSVIDALCDEWIYRTSPPTHATGMERAIAESFGVPATSVLAGPGSSALMFLAFSRWLTKESRVLLLEPTYGEYAHLCETVLGCQVDRLIVPVGEPLDLDAWSRRAEDYNLVVLVNPNNPTGQLIPTAQLAEALPRRPRVWIDEAYLAYSDQPSLAPVAAARDNVTVVRSFSKSHALSGLRAAALFTHPTQRSALGQACPPWWVSLPAQVATAIALKEENYYALRYEETQILRRKMEAAVCLSIVGSAANWLLLQLPKEAPTARQIVLHCAGQGIYLRDAGRTAPSLGDRTLRIAVKPEWPKVLGSLNEAYATTNATRNPS